MTDLTLERGAATTSRWPHPLTSGVCAFYVYLLAWLALTAIVGALLLGAEALVITSGSMEPRIRAGDVVLATPPPRGELDAGTVIAFRDPARAGQVVTHRIVEVTADGYVTQGDASQAPDPLPVPADAVVGVGRLLVPFVGLLVVWAEHGRWLLLLGWAAATLLAASAALGPVRSRPASTPRPAARREILPAPIPPRPGVVWSAYGRYRRNRARRASAVGVMSVVVLTLAAGTAAAAFTASTVSTGNTFSALTLEAPTITSVVCQAKGPNSEVTLQWSAPSTPYDAFRVYRNDGTTETVLDPTPPDATTLIDTGLAAGTTYTYEVTSRLGNWESVRSASASVTCAAGGGGGGGGRGGGAATLSSPTTTTLDEGSSTPTA